jgi:RNA polymerase sigma factor (sigma-70 family)
LQALGEVQISSANQYFTVAAQRMRWVLLDLIRQTGNTDGRQASTIDEPKAGTGDPADLAVWTEFHRQVDQLPDLQREVVDLHLYQGLTQAETAQILGLDPKEVSRLWLRARLELSACISQSGRSG